MSEKIVVEFEVEKTINHDYGYQEKLLNYAGRKTKYKAIIKDGKLVAILGRSYRLIPNEYVDEMVKKIDECASCRKEEWRWYWFVERGDVGAVVVNSVDGSEALKVYAWLVNTSLLITERVENVYRRHTPNADLSDLKEIIEHVLEVAKEYKEWLVKLGSVPAKPHYETLAMLEGEIPKKYVEKPLLAARSGRDFAGREYTLRQFYEAVAKAIWNASADMRTKMRYYKALNDCMFSIVEWSQ
jgi:hypothetical protein